MKIQKAIDKIEKNLNIKIEKNSVSEYFATYKNHVISFFDNGGMDEVTCICTRNQDLKIDSQTDYFPQTYHDNITQAIKFLIRRYN